MRKQFGKITVAGLILVLALVLMAGCGSSSDEETYNSDWQGAINASQGVQIVGAVDNQVLATYSEDAEIEGFLDALAIDQWTEGELPEDAKVEYNVSFFKEGTITMDDSEGNDSLTVVARIKTYADSNIITLESLGLSLNFEVPDSAVDAIRNAS